MTGRMVTFSDFANTPKKAGKSGKRYIKFGNNVPKKTPLCIFLGYHSGVDKDSIKDLRSSGILRSVECWYLPTFRRNYAP
jgi:hypothetical protein